MTDEFGREIKNSIDDLRKALLQDIGKTEEGTQKKSENTEQLKKINEKLDNIIGGQFNRELQALNKLIGRVADCCKNISKKKDRDSDRKKDAKMIGDAVARSLGAGDMNTGLKKAFADVKPAMAGLADKTMTFGLALERSQKRFGTAFRMIGKQFQQDFGGILGSIRNRINKLNPFREFEKETTKTTSAWRKAFSDTWNQFRSDWKEFTDYISSGFGKVFGLWTSMTNRVSAAWENVKNRFTSVVDGIKSNLNSAWERTTKKAQELWESAAQAVRESWVGKLVGKITNVFDVAFNKVSKYVGPLGKAAVNTVKDFLKIGKASEQVAMDVKKAGRDINDLTAGPTKKVMPGEKPPVTGGDADKGKAIKMDFDDSNLCRCICKCIAKLQGVTIKEGKTRKKEAKADYAISNKAKGFLKNMAVTMPMIRKSTESSGSRIRDELIKAEEAREDSEMLAEKREAQAARGKGIKDSISRGTEKVRGVMTSIMSADSEVKSNLKSMSQMLSNATSKVTGFIAGKPLEIIGEMFKSLDVYGGGLIGVPLKALGEAFGGLAEGITSLVLQPLVEEVGNFQEEMQAMYTIRGATGAVTPDTGMTRMGQGVQDYVDGINIAAKKEEMLKRTAEEITETGQKLSLIQKQHIKNLKMGIREENKFLKASNIGLRAGSQIGANAEQTADMFAEWKVMLGASNIQLGQMDRGLLSIARTTGVFGENLLKAAKASQQFMEHMRLSGTYTAKAATNIIGLMAEAQKRGVGKGMENLMGVLQGSLLGEGGDEKSRMMAMMGIGDNERIRKAMISGTLMQDRRAQRELGQNWAAQLDAIAMNTFGKTFDKLSIEQKGLLSNVTRQIVGKGAEEWDQINKSFIERGKTFADRLNDLNNGAKKGMTALEIKNQKEQLIFDTGGEILEDFNRALQESNGDINQAFDKVKGSSEDIADFLKSSGVDINKGGAAIGDVLKKQMQQVKERAEREGLTSDVEAAGLGKDFDKTLDDAMKRLAAGDRTGFEELMARMTALEGKTREQMRQNADPATKMLMVMYKMEGYLRIMARQAMTELSPLASAGMAAFDEVMDKAAKEFMKGTPEGRAEAIKIIGEAMKKLPAEITRANREVQATPGATPLQRGATTGLDLLFGSGTAIGELISKFGSIIKENADKIESALTKISTSIDNAIKTINENIDMVKTFLNILIGAGGVIVAITLLSTGFGQLLLAIGAIAAAVWYFWDDIVAFGDMLANYDWSNIFSDLGYLLGTALVDSLLANIYLLYKAGEAIITGIVWIFQEGIPKALDWIKNIDWGATLSGAIKPLTDFVGGFFKGIWERIKYYFDKIWNYLFGASIIPDIYNAFIEFFSGLPGKIAGFLADAAMAIGKWAAGLVGEAAKWAVDAVGKTADAINPVKNIQKIQENEKAIQEQGKMFQKQQANIAKEAAGTQQRILSGDPAQVAAERKAAENRAVGAEAAQKVLESNTLVAQRSLEALGKLTGLGLGAQGTTETSMQASWAVEARKREAEQSKQVADATAELAKIEDPAQREREKEKKLREIYNDNLGVANVALAKNTQDAVKALEEARTKALRDLDELRKRDAKRWKLGRGWERITEGQTKEEAEAGRLMTDFQRVEQELEAKKKELAQQEAAIRATGAARESYIKEKAAPVMIASALKEDQLKQLGGVDQTVKLLQDYTKGAGLLRTDDSKLNTIQKAEKAAAQKALDQLQGAGVDLTDYANVINTEFAKLGDLAKVSTTDFKNKMMEVQKKLKMTPDQRKAFDEASQAAKDTFDKSKQTRALSTAIKNRQYEMESGEKVFASSHAEAQKMAKAKGGAIIDRQKMEDFLVSKGMTEVIKDAAGKKSWGKDYTKYAEKASENITEEDVRGFDVTQKLLAEKDKFKQQQMFAELNKTMLQNIDIDKMSWEDYSQAIGNLGKLRKAGKMLGVDKEAPEIWQDTATDMNVLKEAATKPGSIYTHDVYVEKALQGLADDPSKLETLDDKFKVQTLMAKGIEGGESIFSKLKQTMPQQLFGKGLSELDLNQKGILNNYLKGITGNSLEELDEINKSLEGTGIKIHPGGQFGRLQTMEGPRAMPAAPPETVQPMLPNTSMKTMEYEMRKNKAETQGQSGDVDMAKTEANTGATAAGVRAIAKALGNLGRALASRKSSGGLDVSGPDYPLDSFFEEILSTEWPNARLGRTVGLEFDYTDLA